MVDSALPIAEKPIELDTVLVKVASRCNINCQYCYVYHLGDDNWSRIDKLMTFETMDAVSKSLGDLALKQNRAFCVVIHGGEPLLLGYKRLRYFLSKLRGKLPKHYPISIQSNGVLITEEILDLCSEFFTSIAVSIDGPEYIHDRFRKDHKGNGTFQNVITGIEKLQSHSDSKFLFAGVLAVIDPNPQRRQPRNQIAPSKLIRLDHQQSPNVGRQSTPNPPSAPPTSSWNRLRRPTTIERLGSESLRASDEAPRPTPTQDGSFEQPAAC